MAGPLAVIETHPIQYHAPVYRVLQQKFGIPVTAIYGSDFSVAGYRDPEFGVKVAWDSDLLSGYTTRFLSRVAGNGAGAIPRVTTNRLEKILREIRPAAVLLPGYSPGFYQRAFWRVFRLGTPVIFRGETTDHAEQRGPLKRWVRDRFLREIYGRCARLLYVGIRSLQHFKRLGCPEEKLIFSPYGVDTTAFRADEQARSELRRSTRRALGIGEDQRAVLFSGKLSRRKGPDLLLRAVKRFSPAERDKTTVLFLGDGVLRSSLERFAAEEPAIQTRFVGFKNQSGLSPYYHSADALALPSRHSETWGLVVNEALHHGLPCVVTEAVGCGPDLIEPGRTGLVCPNEAEEALADAVREVSTWAGSSEAREQCRRKAQAYSLQEAASGIFKAIQGVSEHHPEKSRQEQHGS